MARALEGRVPFLDHRLVEFCFSAPLEFRLDRVDKRLTRSQLHRRALLPESVTYRRDKRGFATPYAEMMRVDTGYAMMTRIINETVDCCPDMFCKHVLHSLLDEHRGGVIDQSMRIFRAITLAVWLEAFGLSIDSG